MRRRHHTPPDDAVVAAIRHLASVCDGAVQLDGQGFSKDHAPWGHWLANHPPEQWGPIGWHNARVLVRVYDRQLGQR
jgi:hypothetical protein